MPVIAANTVHVQMQYEMNGQLVENEFYVTCQAAPTSTDLDEIADVFDTWASGTWMPDITSATKYTGLVLTSLDSVGGPVLIFPHSPAVTGTRNGTSWNNVSFAIQRIILERFRGGHPRLYVPGIPDNALSGTNTVQASYANELVADLETLRANLLAHANTYILSALRSTPSPRTKDNPEAVPIVGHRYNDLVIDSQRRRLPGRGQ